MKEVFVICRRRIWVLYLGFALVLLGGCGRKTGSSDSAEQKEDKEILVLATFNGSEELTAQVEIFNETHEDFAIEIKEYGYSVLTGEDTLDAVRREIATGKGPDIINFGTEFTGNALEGNYTENLLPYLEKDERLRIEDFFGNILETFYYEGEMRAIPVGFSLDTFAGLKKYLGEKGSWTIQEMMQCYLDRGEGVVLQPYETKRSVFGEILAGSQEHYIDWEEGECFFDSQEFQDVLAFTNLFPGEAEQRDEFSRLSFFQEGKALLKGIRLTNVYDIATMGVIFGGEEVTYIGYPVEGDCGTAVMPANIMLAISANSRYKEEAWDFIAQFLSEEYQVNRKGQDGLWPMGFPIRKSALEKQIREAMEITYARNKEGEMIPEVKSQVLFAGEAPMDIYSITQKEADELWELVVSANLSGAFDWRLHDILLEEAQGYFDGIYSLEETAERMQRRATVYVSEKSG